MEWIIAVVAVAALGVAAVAAAGGVGEMRGDPVEDVYRQERPEGLLSADEAGWIANELKKGLAP